jgi:hypothetical protein
MRFWLSKYKRLTYSFYMSWVVFVFHLYASKIENNVLFLRLKLAGDWQMTVTSWVQTNFYSSTINSTQYELNMKDFLMVSLIHVKRHLNEEAHILAKTCFSSPSSEVFYLVSECIRGTICIDVIWSIKHCFLSKKNSVWARSNFSMSWAEPNLARSSSACLQPYIS